MLGISRKSIICMVMDLPPDHRLEGISAIIAVGITSGVGMAG